jgi:hypothetical protein
MRGRNESAVYFEQRVDVSRTLPWLEAFRERTGLRASLLHLVVWAAGQVLHERPRLNRFTAGGRLWQRRGIWVSVSAKKALGDEHPIVVVKREIDPARGFADLVRDLLGAIAEGRSERPSATDRELSLVLKLPGFVLAALVRLQMALDRFGLLPGALLRSDPLYASLFVANLGSVGLDACWHHLYEYGNIPIFLVMGKVAEEPGGRRVLPLRYTFDERIEDGLYCARALELLRARVEDPAAHVSESSERLAAR